VRALAGVISASSDDGYRFAKCEGKPNVTHASKAAPNKDFCISMPVRPHIAFRFDSLRCLNCSSKFIGHDLRVWTTRRRTAVGTSGAIKDGRGPRSEQGG
jgi:hypothetical protein